MKQDKISIIIPIYNAEKYLDKCIKSIVLQKYKNMEIILVNDGSIDSSLGICKRYAEKDSRIILINKENTGVSDSRNVGISKATGKYITFIDADDYISNDYIYNMVNEANDNIIVKASINYCYSNKKSTVYQEKEKNIKELLNDFLLYNKPIFSCGWLLEKKYVPEFDTNTKYMEDSLFIIEYFINLGLNKKIIEPKNVIYNYCLYNSNNTNNKKNSVEKIKSVCYSLDKINEYLKKYYNNEELDYLDKKKIWLCEIYSKHLKSNEYKHIFDNYNIRKSINIVLNNPKIILKKYQKLFCKIIIKKSYIFMWIYLRIRKITVFFRNLTKH